MKPKIINPNIQERVSDFGCTACRLVTGLHPTMGNSPSSSASTSRSIYCVDPSFLSQQVHQRSSHVTWHPRLCFSVFRRVNASQQQQSCSSTISHLFMHNRLYLCRASCIFPSASTTFVWSFLSLGCALRQTAQLLRPLLHTQQSASIFHVPGQWPLSSTSHQAHTSFILSKIP